MILYIYENYLLCNIYIYYFFLKKKEIYALYFIFYILYTTNKYILIIYNVLYYSILYLGCESRWGLDGSDQMKDLF